MGYKILFVGKIKQIKSSLIYPIWTFLHWQKGTQQAWIDFEIKKRIREKADSENGEIYYHWP